MQKHVKLAGIIAYDNQMFGDTMFNDATDQYAFGGDSHVLITYNAIVS